MKKDMHLFERVLSVNFEEIELSFLAYPFLEWSRFLLNPRRLRGSDFLMRWSQGEWSESRVIQAVNETQEYFALPYGPSGTAPDNDVRAFELYFERLEAAGLGKLKRPDLLIFQKEDQHKVEGLVGKIGGVLELPFTPEQNDNIIQLLSMALVAVECENSLWKGKMMPDFGAELKPQKRLGGRIGLKKTAVLPTIILKEEDRVPLLTWQNQNRVPVHLWHIFYDIAYGIDIDTIQELIDTGRIQATDQVFQSPGGATTTKKIYKVYYHYGYPLGDAQEEPQLSAKHIVDKNGHILPYVHFQGGKMLLREEARAILRDLTNAKKN